MSNRVTEKQLQAIVDRINTVTKSPIQPYSKNKKGMPFSNIGNYHLSHAYGGVSLHRMVNECGGVDDVFRCGHVPKRVLADLMHAFLSGIEA